MPRFAAVVRCLSLATRRRPCGGIMHWGQRLFVSAHAARRSGLGSDCMVIGEVTKPQKPQHCSTTQGNGANVTYGICVISHLIDSVFAMLTRVRAHSNLQHRFRSIPIPLHLLHLWSNICKALRLNVDCRTHAFDIHVSGEFN